MYKETVVWMCSNIKNHQLTVHIPGQEGRSPKMLIKLLLSETHSQIYFLPDRFLSIECQWQIYAIHSHPV